MAGICSFSVVIKSKKNTLGNWKESRELQQEISLNLRESSYEKRLTTVKERKELFSQYYIGQTVKLDLKSSLGHGRKLKMNNCRRDIKK